MKKTIKIFLLISVCFFFVACNTKTPYTNRSQLILISQEQELALGEQSYKKALKNSNVIKNTQEATIVKQIGERIAKVANIENYKWEFNLVKDKAKNAFCLPGGKVVVYSGILEVAKNEDQLATVISHEIAHALARHGAERLTTNMISNAVGQIGTIALGAQGSKYTQVFNLAYGLGAQYGILLPYSRMQENEADEIGIHLMYKAGYNVKEAISFWKNMSKGSKSIEFLSTHPSSTSRVSNINRIINSLVAQK